MGKPFILMLSSVAALLLIAFTQNISWSSPNGSKTLVPGELIVIFNNDLVLKKAKGAVTRVDNVGWKRSVVDQQELRLAVISVPKGKEQAFKGKLENAEGVKSIHLSSPNEFNRLVSKRKFKASPGNFESARENTGQWVWIPNENYVARDGSTSGFMVNLSGKSNKFLIYLQGGGAASNAKTSIANPNHFDLYNFENFAASGLSQSGIFDRSNSENIFRDWNIVFLVYVSGDVHSGNNPVANVPDGPQNQVMQGHNNVRVAIDELKNNFGDKIEEVFLTGSSAGGFGSLVNYDQVAQAFPKLNISMLSDAGPVFINRDVYSKCLDEYWQSLFKTVLPQDLSQIENNGIYYSDTQKIYEYLSLKYPEAQFGLYSTYMDRTIRNHYGFGQNNCENVKNPIAGDVFKKGLLELNDKLLANLDNWKVYFHEGESHTILLSKDYPMLQVNSTQVIQWVSDLVQKKAVDIQE